MKETSNDTYGQFWPSRMEEEFIKIFKRKPNWQNLTDDFYDILNNETGIHFCSKPISMASYAFAMQKCGA